MMYLEILKLYLKNYLKFKATVILIFKGDENVLMENKNIYTPAQLFKYKMTDEENSIWEQLKDTIINACNELKLPEEYFYYVNVILDSNWDQCCGYKQDCGFYSVYCDRGNYSISDKHPESDYDKAKFYFLKNIIWSIGNRIECSSRKILKEEWTGKVNYDSRKYRFEYEITMLNKIFNKEYMDELVKENTEYMNRWFYFDHWKFDYEKMQFVEFNNLKEYSSRHFIKVKIDSDNDKSIFQIDKNEVEIEDVIEYECGICIRLGTFPKGIINNGIMNNVYMIDFEGKIIWNIKDVLFDHLGRDKNEWYPAIWKLNESTLRVSSFRCITFDISINSREVVNEIFTK